MKMEKYNTVEEFIDYCRQSYRNYIIERDIKIQESEILEDINRLEKMIRNNTSYKHNASLGGEDE